MLHLPEIPLDRFCPGMARLQALVYGNSAHTVTVTYHAGTQSCPPPGVELSQTERSLLAPVQAVLTGIRMGPMEEEILSEGIQSVDT